MNPSYNYTDADRMNPIYCIGCRQHIPDALSKLGRGLCPNCIRKINGAAPPNQRAQTPPPQAPPPGNIPPQGYQAPPQPNNGMPQAQAAPKANNKGAAFGCAFLAVLSICLFGNCVGNHGNEASSATSEQVAARGPKPLASSWDGLTPEVNHYLKDNLKDPSSLELINASVVVEYGEDAWAQRVKYRAKNGFGALGIEEQLFVIRNGEVISAVNLQ